MNDDLKAKLMEILSKIQDGVPGAWDVLTEQYAGYHLAVGGTIMVIMGFVALGAALLFFKTKGPWTQTGNYGITEMTEAGRVRVAIMVFFLFLGIVLSAAVMPYTLKGVFPVQGLMEDVVFTR